MKRRRSLPRRRSPLTLRNAAAGLVRAGSAGLVEGARSRRSRSLAQRSRIRFAQTFAAIGLSGQMHGAVLLDRAGAPIRPAILWNDGRATAECEALHRAVPDLRRIAGIIAMPGFTAPKLLWLKRHEPESFRPHREGRLAEGLSCGCG